jgi:hypothetical protein
MNLVHTFEIPSNNRFQSPSGNGGNGLSGSGLSGRGRFKSSLDGPRWKSLDVSPSRYPSCSSPYAAPSEILE